MGKEIPPSGSNQPSDYHMSLPQMSKDYTPQFKIDIKHWRSYWQTLFPHTQLTDKEVHQMTDQFVKFVWNGMNEVLKKALEAQKERERKRKEDEGG